MNAIVELMGVAAAMAEEAMEARVPAASVEPRRLHAAMRHSLFAGGKRLRPALVLAACRACGGRDDAALPGMAAVEMLHTYTLIHDDLPAMDDDDLRRGRPTCHKAFDEATAILAGDALQAAAFAAAAETGLDAVRALAEAASSLGVVGGQQDDLDAEGLAITPAAMPVLERIHRRKTAALLVASCRIGGIAAGAGAAQLVALTAYGEAAGIAFQIADDVLDATADAATLGKTPGKDAAQGKLTWVALRGLDQARADADAWHRRAVEALAGLPHDGGLRGLAELIVRRDR